MNRRKARCKNREKDDHPRQNQAYGDSGGGKFIVLYSFIVANSNKKDRPWPVLFVISTLLFLFLINVFLI